MSSENERPPRLAPSWFLSIAWRVHRGLHRISGGRFLWPTSNKRGWGALRLTTVRRRSGEHRSVIVGYLEDGADLVLLAMNGWQEGHTAWWLNLQAEPNATVHLSDATERLVRAREATGDERERLWELWSAVDPKLDGYAAQRTTETPVVVLEPI